MVASDTPVVWHAWLRASERFWMANVTSVEWHAPVPSSAVAENDPPGPHGASVAGLRRPVCALVRTGKGRARFGTRCMAPPRDGHSRSIAAVEAYANLYCVGGGVQQCDKPIIDSTKVCMCKQRSRQKALQTGGLADTNHLSGPAFRTGPLRAPRAARLLEHGGVRTDQHSREEPQANRGQRAPPAAEAALSQCYPVWATGRRRRKLS